MDLKALQAAISEVNRKISEQKVVEKKDREVLKTAEKETKKKLHAETREQKKTAVQFTKEKRAAAKQVRALMKQFKLTNEQVFA